MKLQTLLNDFELDWAQYQLQDKQFSYQFIQEKRVAVLGNSPVTEALLYSLLSVLESGKAAFQLAWCPLAEDADWCLKPEVREIEALEITAPEDLSAADFLIYNGLCAVDVPEERALQMFSSQMEQTHRVLQTASRLKPERFLLLSDYRAMERENTGVHISEYEHSLSGFSTPEALPRMLMQVVEGLCRDYARQYDFPCNILRTAMVMGACLRPQENFICDLARRAAAGEEIFLAHTGACYSYVSIHDVLSAVWAVLACQNPNHVFHVSGPGEPITPEEIYAILYKRFPKTAKVTFLEKPQSDYGAAFSAQKLKVQGWEPKIPFEDGLILLVKSIQDPDQTFLFQQSYQGKLDEIHQLLLAHLLEIDRICKKHNIRYFLAGGTLLGAIRHHGFIPWDDDADVMMTREDFERFSAVVQQELPGTLFFQSSKTEAADHHMFRKIRINNTIFATAFTAQFAQLHNGVFADVVAHDATADHGLGQKLHMHATRLSRTLVFNKWQGSPVKQLPGMPKAASSFLTLVKNVMPMSTLEAFQEGMITFFRGKKHPKYYYDGMGRNLMRGAFPAEYLDEVIEVDFEGYKLPVPREYDKYLTWLYGDYMKMIPASQRHTSHEVVWVDLGEYEQFRLPRQQEE